MAAAIIRNERENKLPFKFKKTPINVNYIPSSPFLKLSCGFGTIQPSSSSAVSCGNWLVGEVRLVSEWCWQETELHARKSARDLFLGSPGVNLTSSVKSSVVT